LKRKLSFIISFTLLSFFCGVSFSGCGRKAPPVVPEIIKPASVKKITFTQERGKITFLISFQGKTDLFNIYTARIECKSCPANYHKVKTIPGNERCFSLSGYEDGDYKLKIIPVLKKIEGNPLVKDFKINGF